MSLETIFCVDSLDFIIDLKKNPCNLHISAIRYNYKKNTAHRGLRTIYDVNKNLALHNFTFICAIRRCLIPTFNILSARKKPCWY